LAATGLPAEILLLVEEEVSSYRIEAKLDQIRPTLGSHLASDAPLDDLLEGREVIGVRTGMRRLSPLSATSARPLFMPPFGLVRLKGN
jgi:hypothetical protein